MLFQFPKAVPTLEIIDSIVRVVLGRLPVGNKSAKVLQRLIVREAHKHPWCDPEELRQAVTDRLLATATAKPNRRGPKVSSTVSSYLDDVYRCWRSKTMADGTTEWVDPQIRIAELSR